MSAFQFFSFSSSLRFLLLNSYFCLAERSREQRAKRLNRNCESASLLVAAPRAPEAGGSGKKLKFFALLTGYARAKLEAESRTAHAGDAKVL